MARTCDGMIGVRSEQKDEPFLMSIDEVFHLSGRNGTTVVGPIVSGIVKNGDSVGLWRKGELVATANATVDLVCSRDIRPQRSSLTFSEIAGSDAQTGDEVRWPVA
jgi:translation elongation factor EF-Tu-like GTPase